MTLVKYALCISFLVLTFQKSFELFKDLQCRQRNRLVTTQIVTQLLALKNDHEWVYSSGYCHSLFQGKKYGKEIRIYRNFKSYQLYPIK